MKPIKVLELSEVDRLKLEKGYHNGPTHSFRIRCKSILLKSEGKSAPKIAEMLEVTVPTVYIQGYFLEIGCQFSVFFKILCISIY